MVNIAVFASGSGTNFETILSHIEDGSLHVNCACLIADKENAYARVRAHNHGVEEFYLIQRDMMVKRVMKRQS